ncbi:MAG: DUF4340 domain-containing protein [Planctomycetota bacterium]
MMGWRGILILFALVAGLGVVLLLTDEQTPVEVRAESPVREGRALADATMVRWQFRDRPPIEVGRGPDGRFQMREPLVDVASAAYMKQICDAWESAQMRKAPLADDAEGRRQAGLEEPELTFLARFPDGREVRVDVGAEGPLGTTRFLRAHGAIWEGGQALLESMRANPDDLREKAVFRNAFGSVDELRVDHRLDSGARELVHLKLGEGGWRLLAPVTGRADPAAARQFVTAVLSLRVDHFAPGIARTPDAEPRLRITVHGQFGEEKLTLWDERHELYGSLPGRGLLFHSTSQQYAQIFANASERLRARILLPFAESAFAELVDFVVDPGQGRGDRMRLVRESPSADWRLVEPVEAATRPTPCNEALEALQVLTAVEFCDDAAARRPRAEEPRYGLQAGRLAVAARAARDTAATTLWFGADVDRGEPRLTHACRADEPDTVVLVPAGSVAVLRRSWLEYCALRALQVGAIVERVDLARPDGSNRSFRLEDGVWRRVGAEAASPEVGDFVQDELRDLVAARAVDARPSRYDRPDWTVRLLRRNGDELASLRVFEDGPERALVVQAGERGPVAHELTARQSRDLRALWQ